MFFEMVLNLTLELIALLAPIVTAINVPPRCKSVPMWRPSLNEVARIVGPIGGRVALSSYVRPLLNGRENPGAIPSGQRPITNNKKPKANPIKPLSGHWHLSGSGSCLLAGKPIHLMMNRNI